MKLVFLASLLALSVEARPLTQEEMAQKAVSTGTLMIQEAQAETAKFGDNEFSRVFLGLGKRFVEGQAGIFGHSEDFTASHFVFDQSCDQLPSYQKSLGAFYFNGGEAVLLWDKDIEVAKWILNGPPIKVSCAVVNTNETLGDLKKQSPKLYGRRSLVSLTERTVTILGLRFGIFHDEAEGCYDRAMDDCWEIDTDYASVRFSEHFHSFLEN